MINLRLAQQQNDGNKNNRKLAACRSLSTLSSPCPSLPEKWTTFKKVALMKKAALNSFRKKKFFLPANFMW